MIRYMLYTEVKSSCSKVFGNLDFNAPFGPKVRILPAQFYENFWKE